MPNLGKDDFTALSCAIGSITLAWAQLEINLDFAVSAINCHFRNSKLVRKAHTPLQSKLAYLEKALKVIPELAPVRDTWLELLPTINHYAKQRHIAVHSAAMLRKDDAAGVFLVQKFRADGGKHFLDIYEFDVVNQYPVLLDAILGLARRTSAFSEAVFDIAESNTQAHP